MIKSAFAANEETMQVKAGAQGVVSETFPGMRRSSFDLHAKRIYRKIWRAVHYIVVFGLCFIILHPVIMMVSSALMAKEDVFDITVVYIPRTVSLRFPRIVYASMGYPAALANSFALSLSVGIVTVFTCSAVGYGFARFRFPGKKVLFGLLIFSLVVPPSTILISQYIHFKYFDFLGIIRLITGRRGVNLINSFWPFIFTAATVTGHKNALYVYLMRQFFRNIPNELEESAFLDGSGSFRTYWTIVLPGAVPILTTCFLFSFVWQWTDQFYTAFYTQNLHLLTTKLSTLVYDVNYRFYVQMGINPRQMIPLGYEVVIGNTGVLFVIAPLILIYLFAQRSFTESIERSGLKM